MHFALLTMFQSCTWRLQVGWVLQDPQTLSGSQPLGAVLLKRCKEAASWQLPPQDNHRGQVSLAMTGLTTEKQVLRGTGSQVQL